MMWYERFAAAAAEHAHRRAIVTPGRFLTYAELQSRADAWHRAHAGETGRVVSVASDPLECLDALFGGWRAGRSVALLPSTLAPPVLAALQERLAYPVPLASAPADQEFYVLSTSGTTGLPKLVAQGQRCATTIVDYVLPWYDQPPGTRTVVASPVATPAVLYQIFVALTKGWEVHLLPPGTPIPWLHEYILKERMEMVCGAMAFFSLLHAYAPQAQFPGVAYTRMSGEPMTAPLQERVLQAFPNAAQFVTYGSTDAMRIGSMRLDDARITEGCVGDPEKHHEVSIRSMPGLPSDQGELHVRGPAVCLGYIGATGTYEGLTTDGWLPMRDLAHLAPDGSLYIHGRVDTLFKCSGQWVNPTAVEQALVSVPGVNDARCFAEPHATLGNVPVAEIVAAPCMAPREPDLLAACRARLERHQVPRAFRFVADVARGESGKKQRR